ncbi:MAG: response regulator, partial [candidate division Zixibacteria bacterium]
MTLDTKIKVLIVDDMPNMRKTIRNMLRSIGFANIEEAADGEKALEKINSGGFGLVISDWKMPRMDGIQLLKKTRDNIDLKSIPFLIITAEISQNQIAQAAETEVDGYIIKPFNAATLKNKIENVFERKSKPSPIDAIINLSKAMIKAGQNSNALEALLNALKEYPNSARLMATIGKAYEENENYQEAKKFYNKARKSNPMFVSAHAGLGELYLKLDDHEKALEYLEAA